MYFPFGATLKCRWKHIVTMKIKHSDHCHSWKERISVFRFLQTPNPAISYRDRVQISWGSVKKSSLMAVSVQHKSPLSCECCCSACPTCTELGKVQYSLADFWGSSPFKLTSWGLNMMLICWAELQTVYGFVPPPSALSPVPTLLGFFSWTLLALMIRGPE